MFGRVADYSNPIEPYLNKLSQLELPINIYIKLLAGTMNHIVTREAWLSLFEKEGTYDTITKNIGIGAQLTELCENLISMSSLYQGKEDTIIIADIRKSIRLSYIESISKTLSTNPTVGQLIAYLVLDKNSQKFCFTDCLVVANQSKGVKLFFEEMHNPKRYSSPSVADVFMKQVVRNIKLALSALDIDPLSPIAGLELMKGLSNKQMNELLMISKVKSEIPSLNISSCKRN